MNLLFVNPNVPYPPKNGGKIRTYSFLKFLSERHNIYLIAFDDRPEDVDRIKALKEVCKEVIVVPLRKAHEKKRVMLDVQNARHTRNLVGAVV